MITLNTLLFLLLPILVVFAVVVLKLRNKQENRSFSNEKYQTIDDKYNERKRENENNINRILDKIHRKGLSSLTAQERKMLDEHAKKSRGT